MVLDIFLPKTQNANVSVFSNQKKIKFFNVTSTFLVKNKILPFVWVQGGQGLSLIPRNPAIPAQNRKLQSKDSSNTKRHFIGLSNDQCNLEIENFYSHKIKNQKYIATHKSQNNYQNPQTPPNKKTYPIWLKMILLL